MPQQDVSLLEAEGLVAYAPELQFFYLYARQLFEPAGGRLWSPAR